jgi:hypothetical protein
MRQLSRKEWPYQVRFPIESTNDRADPRLKWLYEYYGMERNDNWNYVNIGPFLMVYLFKNEQDHLLFTLRWA